MSNVESVSISISITESSSSNASQSGQTQQTKQNPFADPNGPFANLDLTAAQQQQIAQIFSQGSGQSSGSGGQSGQSLSQLLGQVNALLTPQQQQTLQSDLKSLRQEHHHHSGDSSGGSNPLSELDLTTSQQTEIGQIIQAAQTSGSSASDTLNQIDGVLTPTQQQSLISLFSADTASGSSTQSTQPYVINTSA
jgi:Spy/CpxP family protein refolding chaperone